LPGSRVTTYAQDGFGRDTSVQALEVPRQRIVYDLLNRVVAQYDSAGATPTLTFWGRTRPDSVEDPLHNKYRFAYNALGWVIRRTDPANARDTTQYDIEGLPRRWTNRRLQSVDYTYDALHRLRTKSGTNTTTDSLTYTADGRRVGAWNAYSVVTRWTGTTGLVDSVHTAMAGRTFRQYYRHDNLGRLDSTWTDTTTLATLRRRYVYSPTGALDTILLGGATTALIANNEELCPKRRLPGGYTVAPVCNGLHEVAMVNAEPGAGASFANSVATGAAYDSAGRIVREIRSVEGTGIGYDWQATGYTYDRLGRLRAESIMVNSSPPASCDSGAIVDEYGNSCLSGYGWVATSGTTYSYDAVGNRTDRSGSYTTGNRITAFDGCPYTTDADGNVTSRTCGGVTTSFYWSAESRLDSVRVGTLWYRYRYDALGRLMRRDSVGTAVRHYLWDGDNLLAELNETATAKVGEYSYYSMDQLHAFVVGTTAFYGHQDVRGNTLSLTVDTLGYQRLWYNAWGTRTSGGDPFNGADRARWKGALSFEGDAGLYYMRNRWYEPRTGRFISEDPIGLLGGVNLYAFSDADPVNGWDPTGLCPMGWFYHGDYVEKAPDAEEGAVRYYRGQTYQCSGGKWVPFVASGQPSDGLSPDGLGVPQDATRQPGPMERRCSDLAQDVSFNIAADLVTVPLVVVGGYVGVRALAQASKGLAIRGWGVLWELLQTPIRGDAARATMATARVTSVVDMTEATMALGGAAERIQENVAAAEMADNPQWYDYLLGSNLAWQAYKAECRAGN
jgi:RHS repeat-associated protein